MGGKWKKYGGPKKPEEATANGQHQPEATAMEVDAPVADVQPAATVEPAAISKPKPHKQQKAAIHQQPQQSSGSSKASTLSIAVAGSAIEQAPNPEAAAAVAAQIARAAAIFGVEEVVVYDDSPSSSSSTSNAVSVATATLARMLQYIETPGHLRDALFPGSKAYPELRAAEALTPTLNAPHHVRGSEWQPYREGVVMRSEPGMGSFVDIGYDRNAHVEVDIPTGRRVTLHLGDKPEVAFVPAFSETMVKGKVVAPTEPHQRTGMYWGFTVRVCHSLSRVLKEGPHKHYDLSIGTSREGVEREVAELVLPHYKHAMVVFGGSQGLQEIAEQDEAMVQANKTPSDVFSMYLNCCPGQGVSAIKTEDAVTLCLAYLHASLQKFGHRLA